MKKASSRSNIVGQIENLPDASFFLLGGDLMNSVSEQVDVDDLLSRTIWFSLNLASKDLNRAFGWAATKQS